MSIAADLDTTPELGDDRLTPATASALLADLVEVLLPGEGLWPSGRDVGVQALVALRLLEQRGKAEFPKLLKAILAAGGPLAGQDEAARVATVQRLEAAEPTLFGWVRDAAYIAYYENPFVAEAINASGHRYELRPHFKGYPVQRFDIARQTPRHGRGRFTATDQVRRVDITGLDLDNDRTQSWGLKR